MIEKIAQFNAKMEELELSPENFFVITFWEHSPICLQGYYGEALARKLNEVGFEGTLNKTTGYVVFNGYGMTVTLC